MVVGSQSRYTRAVELVVCGVLVAAFGVFALAKMDYFGATSHHVRMTDNSRSAYVAKNFVEGRGYSTRELPAFLLDFYDRAGKLHTNEWVNADRFPFTTVAIAVAMLVTGSTSYQIGILGYNLVCFVAFLVLLYWLARTVWNDRWAAIATLALTLLHPLAYVYPLYLKDADLLSLTTALLAVMYLYFRRPPNLMSRRLAAVLGTLLAWLFLARPNVGLGFTLYFGLIVVRRVWVERRTRGLRDALRTVAGREGVALAVAALWLVPFVVYSMSEWGTPFFTANAAYQMPLGTRYAMNTDTWYKYSEPGHPVTFSTLFDYARSEMVTKFTTSWLATLKAVVRSFAVELFLGLGMIGWLSHKVAIAGRLADPACPEEVGRAHALLRVARMMGFTVLLNLAILPLYGYQDYPYRHYLCFFEPLIWMLAGHAIAALARRAWPAVSQVAKHVRGHAGWYILGAIVAIVVWNMDGNSQDENQMFVRTANFVGVHWLACSIALALLLWHRILLRNPGAIHVVIALSVLIIVRYRPYYEIKLLNLNWFPANQEVWTTLRERSGPVMSFALQGEVNWVSNRRNIPAPENILHVYSFLFDHNLEIEDVYIESAEAMIGPRSGPFYFAAPGFESYVRMQTYRGRLPGYDVVFHELTTKGYPKFRIVRPQPKGSTVYRLSDREAVRAMRHSPEHIQLGSVDNVVYTTHGWGGYYTIEGKPALAALNVTRMRFTDVRESTPWEDSSITFFLDEHKPTSLDLEVYAVDETTLTFYWNLDLYYYDAPGDRKAHEVAKVPVTATGWQHLHIDVPPGVQRTGMNKLGFRASNYHPVAVCPRSISNDACEREGHNAMNGKPTYVSDTVTTLRDDDVTEPTAMIASVLVGNLEFEY